MSIGSGMMTTFKLNTSTGMWIGFQIIAASGRGCGAQMVSSFMLFAFRRTAVLTEDPNLATRCSPERIARR